MAALRPLWVLVACSAFWPCYSYSDTISYGYTGNTSQSADMKALEDRLNEKVQRALNNPLAD